MSLVDTFMAFLELSVWFATLRLSLTQPLWRAAYFALASGSYSLFNQDKLLIISTNK
jgi:hypothetical protein